MTMTLEMTEKQRHRAMRQMREDGYPMDEQPEPSQYTKYFHELLEEREKNRHLSDTISTLDQQRISAEATRFAALHILEDIVTTAEDLGGGDFLVQERAINRAKTLVSAHRGSSELPR